MLSLEDKTTTAIVMAPADRLTGVIKIKTKEGEDLDIFGPSFFGGTFAPYPKVGETLNIKLVVDDFGYRVSNAWHTKSIPV